MGPGINSDYPEKSITDLLAGDQKTQYFMGLDMDLGYTNNYLSQAKKCLFRQAGNNKYFAVGLSEGIGNVFPYVKKT